MIEKSIFYDIEKLKIIAPLTFVFNEIEHFGRIQSEIGYVELQKFDIRFESIRSFSATSK